MRICMKLIISLFIILMLPCISQAIPQMMNYQGRLTDGSGDPITTTTSVEFRIWDAVTGGTELWMEPQSVTPDADGLFSVMLDSVNSIPDSALAPAEAYLGITVGGSEITPRTQLVAVSYAYRVATVDGASGGNITSKVSIGPGHTNTGDYAFVAGSENTASGNGSTVGGGAYDTASGLQATVGGGILNNAEGARSTIGGEHANRVSFLGSVSTIGGGGDLIAPSTPTLL